MPRATRYLPTVDWKTIAKNVVLLTSATATVPATFRVTVKPVDVNEPGATLAVKEVGFYLIDFVGHIYPITDINVGGNPDQIVVSDDFFTGVCPQIERPARIYKSVWKGRSPYLAPVKLDNLDKTARDYLRSFELDVLFSNDPNAKCVYFENVSAPALENYQELYAWDYGDFPPPKMTLVEYGFMDDEVTPVEKILQNVPRIQRVDGLPDGLITRISYDDLGRVISGYMIISRS